MLGRSGMRGKATALVAAVVLLTACTAAPAPVSSGSQVPLAATGKILILSPRDGALVLDPNLTVTGTAPAGSAVTRDVSLAPDAHTTADAGGAWSMEVTLQSGPNTLTFRLGD